jgi:hypothetical protein
MAIKPAINFDKVSGGMVSLNTGLGKLKNSSDTVKIASLNSVKIKRESIARNRMLSNMREEKIKLREQESLVEASSPNGAFKRTSSIIGNSTRGFLDRILDFSSSLLIGWLLYNLPTIMTAIEDLIIRIKSLYGVLTGFMSNLTNTFENFGNLLSAVYQNVTQFDFMDNSKKVQTAIDDLNNNFDLMHDQFMEGFDLLKVPLGEGPGEEPIPELNTDYTQPAPTTGGGQDLYTLATIAGLESGYAQGQADVAQSIYNRMKKSGKGVVDVTTASGQYEPFFGKGKGIDPQSKNIRTFDDAVKYRMKKTGENRATAERSVLNTISAIQDPSKQAAARQFIGTRTSFRGSPQNTGNTLRNVSWRGGKSDNQFLNEEVVSGAPGTIPSFVSSPTKSTQPTGASLSSLPPLPPTNTVANQYYGAPRPGRKHAGVDFDINGPNAKFYSRIGGVVVGNPFRFGADGWAIDIYNNRLRVYERIAEAARIVVKPGQVVNPGDLVAQGESGTGVIHYEIRTKREGQFQNSLDPIAFLKNQKSNIVQSPSPTSPTQLSPRLFQTQTPGTQQAQVSSTTARGQNVPSIGNNRRGQQVIIADNPQQPQPQQVSSKSSGGEFEIILAEDSLNSLIKNQILLELAYT